jgi:hypothetical protein
MCRELRNEIQKKYREVAEKLRETYAPLQIWIRRADPSPGSGIRNQPDQARGFKSASVTMTSRRTAAWTAG